MTGLLSILIPRLLLSVWNTVRDKVLGVWVDTLVVLKSELIDLQLFWVYTAAWVVSMLENTYFVSVRTLISLSSVLSLLMADEKHASDRSAESNYQMHMLDMHHFSAVHARISQSPGCGVVLYSDYVLLSG